MGQCHGVTTTAEQLRAILVAVFGDGNALESLVALDVKEIMRAVFVANSGCELRLVKTASPVLTQKSAKVYFYNK